MIKEINSLAYLFEHKKTKAKVFLISNDDENKVFYIGFRTPQENHTGVPHILEHSVLCGSEKFPLKDPFVELVKGSLNTFLNAMTYPDKTVYPVASCNDKDFQNLIDVYMDAVLHPNIYHERKIFEQEGWHYELESEDAPIIYNGVVYNEMKGAYSSPESTLERHILHSLFPENCYGKDSGGDPVHIPELTYEEFLEFHKTYYHPSNSYIYLYGDMDMEEKLQWLDEAYLKDYEYLEVNSKIPYQTPFTQSKEDEIYYSITEGETTEDATYLSINTVVDTKQNQQLIMAFHILEYSLLDSPGAPLKQALIDAGIGSDILGGYEDGILQPYFSVVAKDANEEQKGEFLAIVKGMLYKLANEGINKNTIKAGLNYFEFKYREADYGSAPKGLMYGLQGLDTWIYESNPIEAIEYESIFESLKAAVEEDYFENLIREYLLDNPFEVIVTAKPKQNLTAEQEQIVAMELQSYKETLNDTQIKELIQKTKDLKEYQDTPSTTEQLQKLPLLTREDIKTEAEKFYFREREIDGFKVLHHDVFTSGIGYLKILFDTSVVDQEDLFYVGLLKSVMGSMDTEKFSYSELASEIHLNSGGLDIGVSAFGNLKDIGDFTGALIVSVRVLYDKIGFGFDIMEEIINHTNFSDTKRLKEILMETKSRGKMKLEQAGHSTAVSRATSYFSKTAKYNEMTGGTEYFHFIEDLAKNFEEKKDEIVARLNAVCQRLFTASNLLINFTADEVGFSYLQNKMGNLTSKLQKGDGLKKPFLFEVDKKNEGLMTSSKVNYVSRCGNFISEGYAYTGALKILQVILSYDYLWLNIRVKGGAYGCMSGFGRSGEGYFASYRDPNIKETNEIYNGVVQYLENFNPDERDMTKYVIGAISNLDTPMTPSLKGARGLSAYLSHVTHEMMQEERDQILNATAQDIRELSEIVDAILKTDSICVVGNEDKIQENKELFGITMNLSKG